MIGTERTAMQGDVRWVGAACSVGGAEGDVESFSGAQSGLFLWDTKDGALIHLQRSQFDFGGTCQAVPQ